MQPPPVRAHLYPYQQDGLAWLTWLDDTGPGGVLADDMGLGKTLQCIALLATLHLTRPGLRVLIVTTTSTVHNWASELRKFAPQLRVAAWTGPQRHADAGKARVFGHRPGYAAHHVVVMSYDTALVDAAFLRAQTPYDWVILDEAQRIKNADSQTYAITRAIPTRRRLAMTGTPIENGVEDFHSLISWAVPGLLGPREWFVDTYSGALSSGDEDKAETLQRVVHPFLLRRRKADVDLRLPEKKEFVRVVHLPPVQRAIYDELQLAAEAALQAGRGQPDKSQMTAIFTIILRLRQVACDPRLFGIPYAGGGKLRALLAIVEEARQTGQKMLVFSSFSEMVLLLERELSGRGIGVIALTGETPQAERPALIQRFERDPKIQVFLIALKAGGAGLNLTAASMVVHFDPWWNPAAEDQATARAHRIGQKRPVTVYRLLAADTIEDSVVETLGDKRALASLLLGEASEVSAMAPPVFAHALRDLRALILKKG